MTPLKEKPNHPRRQARIAVLEAIYAEYIVHEDTRKILKDVFYREKYTNNSQKFIEMLFLKTLETTRICDKLIEENLENWEFSRIALMDKLILRMAITEMVYVDEVPLKVTMSEAIEIAKLYSTKDSAGFVNGILDAIFNDYKAEPKTKAES